MTFIIIPYFAYNNCFFEYLGLQKETRCCCCPCKCCGRSSDVGTGLIVIWTFCCNLLFGMCTGKIRCGCRHARPDIAFRQIVCRRLSTGISWCQHVWSGNVSSEYTGWKTSSHTAQLYRWTPSCSTFCFDCPPRFIYIIYLFGINSLAPSFSPGNNFPIDMVPRTHCSYFDLSVQGSSCSPSPAASSRRSWYQ